jgi:hypothetical protein
VFPVRYELDLYILFRRNSVFKGLNNIASLLSSVSAFGAHVVTNNQSESTKDVSEESVYAPRIAFLRVYRSLLVDFLSILLANFSL